jgi:hypothetical protein
MNDSGATPASIILAISSFLVLITTAILAYHFVIQWRTIVEGWTVSFDQSLMYRAKGRRPRLPGSRLQREVLVISFLTPHEQSLLGIELGLHCIGGLLQPIITKDFP